MAAPAGNRNAAKGTRFKDALNKALAQFATEDGKIQRGEALDKIAETVVRGALLGDKDCWQEIANRLDGKVPQAIIGGDDDDNPIRLLLVNTTDKA